MPLVSPPGYGPLPTVLKGAHKAKSEELFLLYYALLKKAICESLFYFLLPVGPIFLLFLLSVGPKCSWAVGQLPHWELHHCV